MAARNHVAIVTGAGSGVGRAATLRLEGTLSATEMRGQPPCG